MVIKESITEPSVLTVAIKARTETCMSLMCLSFCANEKLQESDKRSVDLANPSSTKHHRAEQPAYRDTNITQVVVICMIQRRV